MLGAASRRLIARAVVARPAPAVSSARAPTWARLMHTTNILHPLFENPFLLHDDALQHKLQSAEDIVNTWPPTVPVALDLPSVDDLVHESPKRRQEKIIENFKAGHFPFKLMQAIA